MAYSHARREELARAKGFPSYKAYRRAPKAEREATTNLLRRRAGGSYTGKPVAPARREWERLAPATQRRHQAEGITPTLYRAGAPLHQAKGMRFASNGEVVSRPTRSKAQRSLIAGWNRAAAKAVESGESWHLRPFVGKKVGGYELECSLETLEDMVHRGELDFEPYGDEAAA